MPHRTNSRSRNTVLPPRKERCRVSPVAGERLGDAPIAAITGAERSLGHGSGHAALVGVFPELSGGAAEFPPPERRRVVAPLPVEQARGRSTALLSVDNCSSAASEARDRYLPSQCLATSARPPSPCSRAEEVRVGERGGSRRARLPGEVLVGNRRPPWPARPEPDCPSHLGRLWRAWEPNAGERVGSRF